VRAEYEERRAEIDRAFDRMEQLRGGSSATTVEVPGDGRP
jgi:hypothetical protein